MRQIDNAMGGAGGVRGRVEKRRPNRLNGRFSEGRALGKPVNELLLTKSAKEQNCKFIQKQHAMLGQRDLAGARRRATCDKFPLLRLSYTPDNHLARFPSKLLRRK